MKMKRSFDPKFVRWVEIVSPAGDTANKLLTVDSVDVNTILEILLKIFEVLLGLGCFGKSRVTAKVKNALKFGLVGSKQELEKILAEIRG